MTSSVPRLSNLAIKYAEIPIATGSLEIFQQPLLLAPLHSFHVSASSMTLLSPPKRIQINDDLFFSHILPIISCFPLSLYKCYVIYAV
jgi:hypothetical protein